ncbi:diguanylate cyclase [Pseudoalteromonas luteoviolacea S2607]|uniref:sensor domain-containing diguanylate cyclase n=1 Tax=Pseudoalteromonas luteoviolacea TaxID=43657 RepID=UPI0007B0AB9F|nr:diguanylate cyclase [Pseudoalteromonas luteoviolacea]KZN31960.1 diguanylate cyclase [Pseudoalteromonas luteoviolacea S2607]
MEDQNDVAIRKLTRKNRRLESLLKKYKQNYHLQHALIQLSEQASTVAELTLLYPAIHSILEQHLPSKSFYVVLQNQFTQTLELSYFVDEKDGISVPLHESHHFDQGVTGYVFENKKVLYLTKKQMQQMINEEKFKALGSPAEHWVGVPIFRDDNIIGVMVSQSYQAEQAYSEHQIELLEVMSLYLATAIERVKKRELLESEVKIRTRALMQSNDALNKEIEQRKRALERQQILFKISELATQFSDIDDVYKQVHKIIRSITFANNLYIALHDKSSNWLSFPYCVDEVTEYRPRPFAKGYSELVITTERSQLIDTKRAGVLIEGGVVKRPPDYNHLETATSWLGAPLKTAQGVIGLIACQAYNHEYEYNHDDVELISFVSNQIASVLQTHLANQALKASNQELEHRVAEKTKALRQTNLHLQMQIEERKKIEQQLYHDAHHDPLTSLPNRSLFLTQLEKTLQKYQRYPEHNFAVLFIDLDKFKVINDELGHQAGDQFLIWVSKAFSECIREHDLLARLAGDEFVILLDHLTDKQQAEDVAKRLIRVMQQPFCMKGVCMQSGASIGITYSNKNYINTDEIIRDADAAMYYAKNAGRGRYEFYHPLLTASTSSTNKQTERHHLTALPTHFRSTEIVDFSNHSQQIVTLEAFGEHPVLGSTSFDILKKFAAAQDEHLDIELDLLSKAQEIAANYQQDVLFACSTIILESSAFNMLKQRLNQRNSQLCLVFDENEVRYASSVQIENLKELAQLGVNIGLNDFAKDRCDLAFLSSIDFKYVLLSSVFSKRVLQQNSYDIQLQGILAITHLKSIQVIAKGPAILNFRSLLEKHGLQLFFGKQQNLKSTLKSDNKADTTQETLTF